MFPILGRNPTFFADLQERKKIGYFTLEVPNCHLCSDYQSDSNYFSGSLQRKNLSTRWQRNQEKIFKCQPAELGPGDPDACLKVNDVIREFLVSFKFEIELPPEKLKLPLEAIPLQYAFSELSWDFIELHGLRRLHCSGGHRREFNIKEIFNLKYNIIRQTSENRIPLNGVLDRIIPIDNEAQKTDFDPLDLLLVHENECFDIDLFFHLNLFKTGADRLERPPLVHRFISKNESISKRSFSGTRCKPMGPNSVLCASSTSEIWIKMLKGIEGCCDVNDECHGFLSHDLQVRETDTTEYAETIYVIRDSLTGKKQKNHSVQGYKELSVSQLLYNTPQFPYITFKNDGIILEEDLLSTVKFKLFFVDLRVRKKIIPSSYKQYVRSFISRVPSSIMKSSKDGIADFLKRFQVQVLRNKNSVEASQNQTLVDSIPKSGKSQSTHSSPVALISTLQQNSDSYSAPINLETVSSVPTTPKNGSASDPLVRDLVTQYLKSPIISPAFSPEAKRPTKNLTVLMSDCLITRQSFLISILKSKCGLNCNDCKLETGIDFIIDGVTGVSFLPASVIRDRLTLKENIRMLVKSVFKFSKLWLIVLDDEFQLLSEDIVPFLSSISNFPCQTIVRYSKVDNIDKIFLSICSECILYASNKSIPRARYQDRKFLDIILNPTFSTHCEFLSTFPTINYFLAAEMLCKYRLFELPDLTISELTSLVSLAPENGMERFYNLLHCHLQESRRHYVFDDRSILKRDLGSDFERNAKWSNNRELSSIADDEFRSNKVRRLSYETSNSFDGQSVSY